MSIPVFDCHCDTIARCLWESGTLRQNRFHLDLERLSFFSSSAQVFAVCTETLNDPEGKAREMLCLLKSELAKNADIARLCFSFADVEKAVSENKIAALLSLEGCEQLRSLEDAYELGVRILHPTWNFDNELCGAVMGSGAGLTEKGKDFIKRAQIMGFALDMSHISEKGFWDTLEIASRPVIAGHSNAKAVCDVPRNLTDEQFVALIKLGGGAGINFCCDFLGYGRDMSAITAHIEHFLSLGGEKSVFLGCDLDGIPCLPKGIDGVQSLGELYNHLLMRNYPEALVRDIFWNNIYTIMEKML